MLRIAVCDDNSDGLSTIDRTSKNHDLEYAVFPNGIEPVSALEKGKRFDVYCPDIIMITRGVGREFLNSIARRLDG